MASSLLRYSMDSSRKSSLNLGVSLCILMGINLLLCSLISASFVIFASVCTFFLSPFPASLMYWPVTDFLQHLIMML